MEGKCKLCEQETSLQESHIIPKFIYSYLKDTSPTGKLREAENINESKMVLNCIGFANLVKIYLVNGKSISLKKSLILFKKIKFQLITMKNF